MSRREKLCLMLRAVRLLGVITILVMVGSLDPASASITGTCSDEILTCSTAEACVSVLHNSCRTSDGCFGTVKCRVESECQGYYNVATVCDVGSMN